VAPVTIGIGLLLIALGLGAYFGTGQEHATALIPAYFGAPLLLLGLVALNAKLRKHAMHVAVIVGLLGFLGALYSLRRFSEAFEPEKVTATVVKLAMAILCALFVALCVRSFIAARRSRRQQQANV
jgi:hypothetical protein